jgi:SAM-dependent methyltransferase
MEKQIWKRATTPAFWQEYSRWYRQWMAHSHYHDRIIDTVTAMASPTWRVLDIGAGNGVLSKPLARMGCEVTALEPSSAMRNLLREDSHGDQAHDGMRIDGRRWETVPCEAFQCYDLVLACNSLHLAQIGFGPALAKVFATKPKRVVVVTELISPEIRIPLQSGNYAMPYARIEQTSSAFAYHSVPEAFEHWSANNGRRPDTWERDEIKQKLIRRGDHLWMDDSALVGMFFWKPLQRT